jgi:hypothetical protein
MDRPGGKRLDRDPLKRRERPVELERHLNRAATHGCENTYRLALQAPQHEPKDFRGARIDPLHVVKAEQKRPVPSKRPYDREEREREQAHLRRRSVGLPHQQRGLECAPLNRRQLGHRLLHHRRKQITDGCECDLRLGMGRARG